MDTFNQESHVLIQSLKETGNDAFKKQQFEQAIDAYTQGILKCSDDTSLNSLKSVLFCNRAACNIHLQQWQLVIQDCTHSLDTDQTYVKAYCRRYTAHAALSKWQEAADDLKKAMELDPTLRSKYEELEKIARVNAAKKFEKEKDEMMGKLKEMGNFLLGKVGLSTDNFKVEKNEENGSMNLRFVQNPNDTAE